MNFREDIKAYIDGELSEARAAEVRSAIDADPALREEYEFMSGLSRQMQTSVKSAEVKGYEKVAASVSGGRRRKFRLVEGLAVAAAIAILGAVMFPMFAQSKIAAKRTALMSEQKQKERLSPASELDSSDADSFDDGLDFTMGAPVPFEEKLAESANGRLKSRELFGSSMGVTGAEAGRSADSDGRSSGGWTVPPEGLRLQAPLGGFLRGNEAPNRDRDTARLVRPNLELTEDAEPRLVIKDASISLKVEDVQEAMDETTLLVKAAKGYIESSSLDAGEKKANGYMTLRVPEREFEGMVSAIRAFGEVKSDQLGGDDVTGTVADIDARIRTLTAEEESYRVLLRNAKKIGDILDIKDRISQVRLQIESYDARRRTLSRLAVLSTITVRFSSEKEVKEEPAVKEVDKWFEDTKVASVGVLKGVGKFVAQVSTFLFILVPIWVPLLLGALWFRGRALRPADAS
ncbi:MAG: DUF4349 domain-containing protein [Armatimonadetes bacterium]|nr:DUF4349 domain-containing protein [Armatimonadota bacterium]